MLDTEEKAMQFEKAHEGEHGHVVDGAWVLFADGARRGTVNWDRLGYELREPPTKPDELVRLQRRFWELKLAELVDEFTRMKAGCERMAALSDGHFNERLGELKALKSKVCSARSKLSHLVIVERGFTQADVERAWDCWERFAAAVREEAEARRKYENAMLGKSSAGILEKLKFAFDRAKEAAGRRMQEWNEFQPPQARSVVNEQLDAQHRAERQAELAAIEV